MKQYNSGIASPNSCCPGRVAGNFTRRGFLQSSQAGFGWLAWQALAQAAPPPAIRPKAKNVIFCFMDGGPSHVDTIDMTVYKVITIPPVPPQISSKAHRLQISLLESWLSGLKKLLKW